MDEKENDSLLDCNQVAKRFSVSSSTVRNWSKSVNGEPPVLAPVQMPGKKHSNTKIVFAKSDVDSLFEKTLEQRRLAPVVDVQKHNDPTAKMTPEERKVYENRRMGRPDGFTISTDSPDDFSTIGSKEGESI